eukprot:comp22592_c0_seq1/m.34613 comp22592_c0_seq1/g.34613  ORF comp22592_c0_seq1/g.34613 comp22592_c0_seq1/m.34613 type:complete len:158 (-) comp22592_c0_seq1:468-941(-)
MASTEPENAICCVIDEKGRCETPAGITSFTKRMQRGAKQKKIDLRADETVGHSRVCAQHRQMLLTLRQQIEPKKRKAEEGGDEEIQVDFTTLHIQTLKRYKRHYKLNLANNVGKAELASAINRHFASLPVNEGRDVSAFLAHAHKRRLKMQAAEAAV